MKNGDKVRPRKRYPGARHGNRCDEGRERGGRVRALAFCRRARSLAAASSADCAWQSSRIEEASLRSVVISCTATAGRRR